MELINKVETVIKSNRRYELVKIDKEYENFNTTRLEIRDKNSDFISGFSGCTLEEVKAIFNKNYNK